MHSIVRIFPEIFLEYKVEGHFCIQMEIKRKKWTESFTMVRLQMNDAISLNIFRSPKELLLFALFCSRNVNEFLTDKRTYMRRPCPSDCERMTKKKMECGK